MRQPLSHRLIDLFRDNKFLFIAFTMFTVVFANLLGHINMTYAIFFIAILVMVTFVVLIFKNPIVAVIINLSSTFLLFFLFYRLLGIKSIPLGFVLEGLNFLAILTLLFTRKLQGWQTQIGTLLLIWLGICFVEFFNPFAASRAAWFQSIRQVINNIMPFFIIYSLLRSNKNTIKILLTTWIVLTTLASLYTLYQEFVGYPAWDMAYLTRDENSMSLTFTFGRMRKISFFSGPMECGVVLAMNSVICLGLAFQQKVKPIYRYSYLALFVLSSWAMIYTGTRTATVIFVAGAAIYIALSRQKELLIYTAVVTFMLIGYIAATGGGQSLYVMTTAFSPDEDPSMQVRFNNQLLLRGYLMKSPIGYGMGSTGYVGQQFSPDTFLGSFPPDSELVRIVIETGMIGLGFYLFMFYMFINKSLNTLKWPPENNYFAHNLRIVFTSILFMFLLGQYPQEILNIGSMKILLSICLAYISVPQEEIEKIKSIG